MNTESYEVLTQTPCDIFLIKCSPEVDSPLAMIPFENALMRDYFDCDFRSIPLDSLPSVLERGIDVNPTNDVIFVAELQKATRQRGRSQS